MKQWDSHSREGRKQHTEKSVVRQLGAGKRLGVINGNIITIMANHTLKRVIPFLRPMLVKLRTVAKAMFTGRINVSKEVLGDIVNCSSNLVSKVVG